MPADDIDRQRKTLQDHLDALLEEYEAAHNQYDRALEDTHRTRIKRQIDALEAEISNTRTKIDQLPSRPNPSGQEPSRDASDDLTLMNKDDWLRKLNFRYSPFDHPAADRPGDEFLTEYAIPFPYLGDVATAGSCIVFAREGHGKSAYRMGVSDVLTSRTLYKRNLVIDYTDFTRVSAVPSPSSHCDEILRLALRRLLATNDGEYPEGRDGRPREAGDILSWLVSISGDAAYGVQHTGERDTQEILSRYSRRLRELEIRAATFGYTTPPEISMEIEDLKFKKRLHELQSGTLNDVSAAVGLTVSEKLERLSTLATDRGFAAIVVLIDPDPLPDDSWSIEVHRNLVKPLVTERAFRRYLQLKLFLPMEMDAVLQRSRSRSLDRDWQQFRLSWSREDLDSMLQLRLWAAGGRNSFDDLIEASETPLNIHGRIVEMAGGSPRELVRLCKFIFSEHVKRPTNKLYFSALEIEQALADFQYAQDII